MKKLFMAFTILAFAITNSLTAQKTVTTATTSIDEMARFPDCENNEDDIRTKQACAEKQMMTFIYRQFKYPVERIEGETILSFEVDKKGNLINPIITKNINAEYDKAVLHVFNKMAALPTKWIPAKRNGKPISVFYNIPMRLYGYR